MDDENWMRLLRPLPQTADEALRDATTRAHPLLGDIRRAAKGATDLGETAVSVALACRDRRDGCSGPEAERAFVAEQVATLRVLAAHGGLSAPIARKAMMGALEHASDPSVVQCLLDAGVDATSRDAHFNRRGCTWLLLTRRADVARLLIAAGADATARADIGIGLHWPAEQRSGRPFDKQLLSVLVQAGADPNALINDGRSPLDFTIVLADGPSLLDRVTSLLEVGADPAAGLGRGKSVQDYIVSMLRDRFNAFQHMHRKPHMLDTLARPLVATIAGGAAWLRRRHLLLAIRDRNDAPVPATAAASAAVGGCATGDEVEAGPAVPAADSTSAGAPGAAL